MLGNTRCKKPRSKLQQRRDAGIHVKGHGGTCRGETGLAQMGAPGQGLQHAQGAPRHAEISEVTADFRAGTVSAISAG